VHQLPIGNCLPRKKALGLCLHLHREGTDNDQCHRACLVSIPVTSNLFFHFALPSGLFLKSLSPHLTVHLHSFLLLQGNMYFSPSSFAAKTFPQPVPLPFLVSCPTVEAAKLPTFSVYPKPYECSSVLLSQHLHARVLL